MWFGGILPAFLRQRLADLFCFTKLQITLIEMIDVHFSYYRPYIMGLSSPQKLLRVKPKWWLEDYQSEPLWMELRKSLLFPLAKAESVKVQQRVSTTERIHWKEFSSLKWPPLRRTTLIKIFVMHDWNGAWFEFAVNLAVALAQMVSRARWLIDNA